MAWNRKSFEADLHFIAKPVLCEMPLNELFHSRGFCGIVIIEWSNTTVFFNFDRNCFEMHDRKLNYKL